MAYQLLETDTSYGRFLNTLVTVHTKKTKASTYLLRKKINRYFCLQRKAC